MVLLPEAKLFEDADCVSLEIESTSRDVLCFTFPPNEQDPANRARAILKYLWDLDDRAFAFLSSLEGWPYGDDTLLWQVIIDESSIRLCYSQSAVNDEQVVGFERDGEGWNMIGHDPRFRRLSVDG